MNNYTGSIDTDMAIGSILSNFDSSWVMHTVEDSLNMRFRPYAEPMPNFVDILNRQFNAVLDASPDYRDQVELTRSETFKEIITCICNYYGLVFTEPFESIQPLELYGIAHTMYDVFISRFTDYMIDFFMNYIIQNSDSIYAYLMADDNVKKPREKDMMANYFDPKFQLIHANVNKVVLNMTSYDISLTELLSSFLDPNTAIRMDQLLSDTNDIYKYYYAVYLQDQRYMAELLTCIKLRLQAKTQEAFKIG